MIIHYSSRAERRRDLASPCSQNTLCDALQVATMINDHGGGLQAYDDDDSMYNWVDDDTAMSPKPFLATITLVIRSGIEVPAAKKVRPII